MPPHGRLRRARARAPAKINLGLRITGRRADGYHEIQSVFLPLALADVLDVELRAGPGVSLAIAGAERADVPGDAGNLAWAAAEAFLAAARIRGGVALRLEKHVPSAAGLGGGSSDAAATLTALATLVPDRLDAAQLAALALRLGADVPWFLDPRPARVGGIGDEVAPLSGFPALDLLLVKPRSGLATASVYRAYDASGRSLTPPEAGSSLSQFAVFRGNDGRLDGGKLAAVLVNDLEPAATRLCPAIAGLRELLVGYGARAVGMTGSGPTLFGIFDTPGRARDGERELRGRLAEGTRTWLTRTLPSPAETRR